MAGVQTSITASSPAGVVRLGAGRSPEVVHQMAALQPEGWSLFFNDGDHDDDAPVNDVVACLPYATPDCAMIFHDLASPHVTDAVLYLKRLGWKTRVYPARPRSWPWRGDVRPVAHRPDPRVEWQIPPHVMPLLDHATGEPLPGWRSTAVFQRLNPSFWNPVLRALKSSPVQPDVSGPATITTVYQMRG